MNNILITPGCCGTNSLLPLLRPRYIVDAPTAHVHERHSSKVDSHHPYSKVVYVFANPYDIILSSCGRRWGTDTFLYHHAASIQSYINTSKGEINKYYDYCDKNGHPQGSAEEVLEIYLDLNQDMMGLEDHYKKWKYNENRTYSIRFIK